MKRVLFAALFSTIAALNAGMASAAECAGVSFPGTAEVDGSAMTLNGLGLRLATMLKIKVYVGALYVANSSADPRAILESNAAKRLVLHFVHDVDAAELNEAWQEGFQHNAADQLAALQERIDKLKGSMADMKSGQQLTFTHKPGAGIAIDVNAVSRGVIEGDDFARAFLSIWLGAHPPNPELKSGLLGGGCG